jgi:drug/metabolite transporter (DMT)-like permease
MSNEFRATGWMVGWLLALLCMAIAGRELTSANMSVFQIMLIRAGVGLAVTLPIIIAKGGTPAHTNRLKLHVVRNFVHFTAQYSWFLAISLIPLAQVVTIEFTMPIWTVIFAALFIGERVTTTRMVAIALGFIGVLVILRPGVADVHWAVFVVVYAAAGFGASVTMTKELSRTDSALTVVFYMFVVQSVIAVVPALYYWVHITAEMWPWVILLGAVGGVSHFFLTKAMHLADASFVVTLDFLRVPATAIIAWLLYSEPLEVWLFAGAVLILAGNLINLRRPASTKRVKST